MQAGTRMRRSALAGVVGIASAVALVGWNGAQAHVHAAGATPVKIGFANPLTGSEASYGVSDYNAVKLAVNSVNAKGGVDGHKVQIIAYDTKADPATGIAGAHYFVSQGVNAVIGFFNSDISIPASAILHAAGIPMVSAASTNPKLTEQGFHNVFRVCGTDNEQGLVEAEFARNVLHAKTAVVLDDEEVYGEGVSQFFANDFKKLGGKILSHQGINPNLTDYTSLLTQVKAMHPDILQFGGFDPAAGLLVKQGRSLGLKSTFISDDGVIGPAFTQAGGRSAVGSFLSSAPSPQDLASARPFVAEYVRTYHAQPTEFAGYNYDALNVIVQAIRDAHSITPAAIIRALAGIHTFKGVTGRVDFNSIGNNTTPEYVIYRVQSNYSNKIYWNPNAH